MLAYSYFLHLSIIHIYRKNKVNVYEKQLNSTRIIIFQPARFVHDVAHMDGYGALGAGITPVAGRGPREALGHEPLLPAVQEGHQDTSFLAYFKRIAYHIIIALRFYFCVQQGMARSKQIVRRSPSS